MATEQVIINNLPPVPKSVMYINGQMNTEWVRWFQLLRDRVGGSDGALIYDAITAAQETSSLEPQLFAIRADLENQFTGILLSIIEQVQEAIQDQALLNEQNSAAITQLLDIQQQPDEGIGGIVQLALDNIQVDLDSVLTAGNVSTLGLTTGNHIIETESNGTLSLLETGGQDWWLTYNSAGNLFGIYDNTAGQFAFYIEDTTNNTTFAVPQTRFENQVLIGYPTDTGEELIVGGEIVCEGSYIKLLTGSFQGDGSQLTDLNANEITSGTLDAARLANSGTSSGTFHYPSIDVDSKGRITGIATNPVVEYVVAGSGISVSSATGGVTITNTAPSDYRLKENIVPLTDLERFDNLRPVRFNFKIDPDKTIDGFIAHEVAEAVPEAVFGEKDGEEMQHLSTQSIIPLLTAKVKQQEERINKLEKLVEQLLNQQGSDK